MKYCRTTRKLLGQDMMNPKRTTQRSVMQQRNVLHSTVGTVASSYMIPGSDIRTVAIKFPIGRFCVSTGKLCVYAEGLDIHKIAKTPLIYSVSCFNLGGLELCWAKPTKVPRATELNDIGVSSLKCTASHCHCQHTHFVIRLFTISKGKF